METAIENLINRYGVNSFLVGNNGDFDYYVAKTLEALKEKHPHITYAIVAAYPSRRLDANTILPDGIETIHPKRAIPYRNEWMIEHSDYVITYVIHSSGGASRFAELARKKNKICINLS